jgi:predicted metal-binding membrane protein
MTDSALDSVLRRDRVIVVAAIVIISACAWLYVIDLADVMSMGGMEMPNMRMAANPFGAAMIPALQPWTTGEFIFALLMWSVMMIGMMTPSAAPMILLYARTGRHAAARGRHFAASAWFMSGYLIAWFGFSLAATTAQWALERVALLTPMMAASSHALAGGILIAAGVYQWTPFKNACLSQCQTPLVFIQRHGGFRGDARGAVALGFRHGLYCIGCCWALMALLFVGGIMNVLWIAGLTLFVLIEKTFTRSRILSRVAGAGLIIGGVWLLFGSYPATQA